MTTASPPKTSTDRCLDGLRVAVVGNFNPPDSGVIYQAEVLVQRFGEEGAHAIPITFAQNRYVRPLATVWELFKHRRDYECLCCQGYSFGNWINGAVSIVMGRLLGKPISMVYRGGGFREFVAKRPGVLLPFLRKVDVLIVPSGFLEHEFDKHGLEARIIPNLIDLDGWPYRRRETFAPKLLWVRHLRTGYNPWMAVEVYKRLREHYPDVTLRMAGDGHMEDEMRRRLAEEDLGGVTLLGHLPMKELQRHYDECDVFINTTNYDNQPRSVLEAMACGLPVVSTDVGGLPFLIDHENNGLLVPPDDPEPMTAAVRRILDDPAFGRRLVEGGRELTASFEWRVSREKWKAVFDDLGALPGRDDQVR